MGSHPANALRLGDERASLRDISNVKTWLFTTLHRAFLVSRRRQGRFTHHDLEDVSDQLPIFTPDLAVHVDSSQVLTALGRLDEVYQAPRWRSTIWKTAPYDARYSRPAQMNFTPWKLVRHSGLERWGFIPAWRNEAHDPLRFCAQSLFGRRSPFGR